MSGGHNLQHEETYQEQPRIVKKREARNRARYQMEKAGLAHKGDGRDVDHIKPLQAGGSGDRANLRVRSRHANRAEGDLDARDRPF